MKSVFLSTIVLLCLSAMLTACGGAETSSVGGFIDSPSDDGGDSGGTLDTSAFSVKAAAVAYPVTTIFHQFYDRDASCEILKSSSTATYTQCLLNIREQDLESGGLKLEFNVPPQMCAYTATVPYWFYNRRPGKGAAVVTITRTALGAGSCMVGGVAGTYSGGRCTFPGGPNSEGSAGIDGSIKCVYNYSSTTDADGVAGPNCCTGNYDLTVTQQNPNDSNGDPVADTVTNTTGSYGGKWGNCVATPAAPTGSGWLMSTSGYPARTITPAINGFNKYNTIKAPITLVNGSNLYAANFFGWDGYDAGAHIYTDAPAVLRNTTDLSGDAVIVPNLPYTFMCMDESFEVKHMIDVYVNDWDSNVEFAKYQNRLAATPIAPAPACGPIPGTCNDSRDWKSFSQYPNENYNVDPAKEAAAQ